MHAIEGPMTAEELWELRPKDRRHELVCGELRTMSWRGNERGAIGAEIVGSLQQFVKAHKLGHVMCAGSGFILGRKPDTVRAPDGAFVAAARYPGARIPEWYFSGAPDLVVEIISPEELAEELDEKVDDWLCAGARLVWVVNPKIRTVTVYVSPAGSRIFRMGDVLSGGDVVPGFELAVAEIFE